MIYVRSHNHLGDSAILTGAVHNVKTAHPELQFAYSGWCPEIWQNNQDAIVVPNASAILVDYGHLWDEQNAIHGNVVEAFTLSLCRALAIPLVPCVTKTPVIHLTAGEREAGRDFCGKILLNANAQKQSQTKLYPYWQEVVDYLHGYDIVQTGSNERRNITNDLYGVTDMRGMTEDVRSLLAMVANCSCVVSPPSGIVNIAAAFGTPCVVVCGARESARLTDYPNMVHVVSRSCGYDGAKNGCIGFSMCKYESRPCVKPAKTSNGTICASCMEMINPCEIADAVKSIAR